MVDLSGGFRTSFKEKIKLFCEQNNLSIKYNRDMGEYTFYTIGGDHVDIDSMMAYVDVLEKERRDFRKSKSLLWRIFN